MKALIFIITISGEVTHHVADYSKKPGIYLHGPGNWAAVENAKII